MKRRRAFGVEREDRNKEREEEREGGRKEGREGGRKGGREDSRGELFRKVERLRRRMRNKFSRTEYMQEEDKTPNQKNPINIQQTKSEKHNNKTLRMLT